MSRPTISENKKGLLLDVLKQLEEEISNLYHLIEDDELIPEDRFRVYEKRLDKLFSLHDQVYEEIYYS